MTNVHCCQLDMWQWCCDVSGLLSMEANTTHRGLVWDDTPQRWSLGSVLSKSKCRLFVFFNLYIVNVKLKVPQVAQHNNSHYSKIKYARLRDQFSQRKCRSGWLCSSGEHEIALTVCVQFMLSLNPVSNETVMTWEKSIRMLSVGNHTVVMIHSAHK